MVNNVVLQGKLEPPLKEEKVELEYTKSGVPMVTFTLRQVTKYKDSEFTIYVPAKAFGEVAKTIPDMVGREVVVVGELTHIKKSDGSRLLGLRVTDIACIGESSDERGEDLFGF